MQYEDFVVNEESSKFLQLASGEKDIQIYSSGECIYRVFSGKDKLYPQKIFDMFCNFGLAACGFVETEYDSMQSTFIHKKHKITYPSEWPPVLFKKAVLYYLDLLLYLDEIGLTLKDALPENILFDFWQPVFVDFFSIVTPQDLLKESWLSRASKTDARLQVIQVMFVPHMLIPLLFYARKDWEMGRYLLKYCYCNNPEGKTANFSMLGSKNFVNIFKNAIKILLKRNVGTLTENIKELYSLCTDTNIAWKDRIRRIRAVVEGLDVNPTSSAYVDYYKNKNEAYSFADHAEWKEKQHSFFELIKEGDYQTMLDLGCNTGWFSRLAYQRKGTRVLAVDVDLACVDNLCRAASLCRESILPLWMGFDDLTSEGYTLSHKGQIQEVPFHLAGTKRFESDLVCCLGLVHHLTLGMGKSFAEIFSVLEKLTKKTLLIEFVELHDVMIRDDPSFFPSLAQWSEVSYSKNLFCESAAQFFSCRSVLPSTPVQSRSLYVFDKK